MRNVLFCICLLLFACTNGSADRDTGSSELFYLQQKVDALQSRMDSLEKVLVPKVAVNSAKQTSTKKGRKRKNANANQGQGIVSAETSNTGDTWQQERATPTPVYQKKKAQEVYNIRTGAVCCDGSHSNATGRGACSHHGGVCQWLYQ